MVGQSETEMFDVQEGVRQGCTLSPWLFNVFIDKVVKETRRDFVSGVKLSTMGVEIQMLIQFADNMVLMAESAEGLEKNLGVMSEALVVISADGSMEEEVEARIGNATRMIGGVSEVVLRRNELSKNTKVKVMNATMTPTLMYGCEAWSLSKKLQSRVQAMQMRLLRRIEEVNRIDRVRNEVIRERLGQKGI